MAEERFQGIQTGGLPKKLPKLNRKQWRLYRQGKLKDIWIERKGGGRSQLMDGEIALLKSIPKLKKNETNTSFKNRVKSWEGLTGITHPNRDKGLKMSHSTAEGRALAGESRVWGLDVPKDYSTGADWSDELKDLQAQKNYDPRKQVTINAVPLNQQEIEDANLQEQLKRNRGSVKSGEAYVPKQTRLISETERKLNEAGNVTTGRNAHTDQSPGAAQVTSEEVAKIKEQLKTDIFTRHYKTGKELGVMTRRQRLAYEKEAGMKTFEGQMEKYKLDPNDPRRETKYTSKSWRNKQDLLIKQQEQQTNKEQVQIGGNNKEKKA